MGGYDAMSKTMLAAVALAWILGVYDRNDNIVFAGEYRTYEECRRAGIATVPRGGKFFCAKQ